MPKRAYNARHLDEHIKNQTGAAIGSKHCQGMVIVNAKIHQSSNARNRSHLYSAARRYCFYTKVSIKYEETGTQKNKCREHEIETTLHSIISRTLFNELQKDLIFLNNKRIASRSLYFIIFSWLGTNEKNSNFQIQHERSAMKWKTHKKETLHNQLH